MSPVASSSGRSHGASAGFGPGPVRVRFAPSPTGFLHVGGARTALFNWLFARRMGGGFILRIEDTDQHRSNEESVRTILEGLRWLGIDWDEGPLFQSSNVEAHRRLAHRLRAEGKAYPCFCQPREIEQKRKATDRAGVVWRYDRTCAGLSEVEVRERERAGTPSVLRFLVPDAEVTWDDLVHGRTSFASSVLEDIVLLRSDGSPTYNLSCVADDLAMGITHVIRGDDHLSNTPKQLHLYRALGAQPPQFAHLPLILGPDKKRLSKRHGAVSVTEYRDKGCVPEALFNFLALLGWSPGDGREKMTRDELVSAFKMESVLRKGSIFDEQKLEWLNGQYINDATAATLAAAIRPWLEAASLWSADLDDGGPRRSWFLKVLDTLKTRTRLLTDLARDARPFLSDEYDYQPKAVGKYLKGNPKTGGRDVIVERMRALRGALEGVETFTEQKTEEALRSLAESRSETAALFIHPLRVALVGRAVSPGVFAILSLIGRDRALTRIDRLTRYLKAGGEPPHGPSAVDSHKSVR